MLIYIFLEHYPNPYKPYIDTQLIHLINSNHTIKIFASGKYSSAVNFDLKKYSLVDKTSYFPNTLKNIPKFFLKIIAKVLCNFPGSVKIASISKKHSNNTKSFILHFSRMLLLPNKSPDLCLLHNLSTVKSYPYLKNLFKDSEIILYYHGGELPRQIKISNAKSLFSKVSHVFTNTIASKQAATNRGCDPDIISVSPVGFNIDDFPFNDNKQFRKNGSLAIVSIGRLSEEKGYIYALEAFNILKISGHNNIHYTIIGEGYLRNDIEQYIDNNNLKDFILLAGEKNKQQVIQILSDADVLILPSITLDNCVETQACVVQEAMLMGLPVITTTVGGVPESIPSELKKLSITPNNPQAIAEMILKVNSFSEEQLQEFGRNGREYVKINYSIEYVTQKILNVLH